MASCNAVKISPLSCCVPGNDRYGGGGGGGGGGSNYSGSSSGDMQEQPDTIFIQGLPEFITEEELCQQFGSIGMIKVCALS